MDAADARVTPSGADHPRDGGAGEVEPVPGFLPTEPERRAPESVLVRLVATAGVIGIATAVGSILGANDIAAWIISLVVSALSVVLAGLLWRSRRL